MRSWLQFLVLSSVCLLVFAGLRCQPDPVTPGTGGTGGEAAATPTVGGSGGWEDPFTGGAPGSGGFAEARCTFTEVRSVARSAYDRVAPKIINGRPADPGTLGYLVSIQSSSGSHYCTGELVAPSWVLTAGHCLPPYLGDRVVVGTHDLRDPSGQVHAIKRALRHERYVDWSEGYDLALLELYTPVDGIEPVRLASPLNPAIVGRSALVAGWGRTCSTCPTSQTLLVAELTVISNTSCSLVYPTVTNTMLCAMAPTRDAAPGDSGGFLGQVLNGTETQVAVVSWGRPCTAADPGANPTGSCVGVYAALADLSPGIEACF